MKSVMWAHVVLMVLAVTTLPCHVICTEDESLDNTQLFSSFDLLGQQQQNPSEVIRLKPSRLADLCQLLRYPALPYYWPKEQAMKKRGYMGIEIPDFITSQDGTQQQQSGGAGGPKPRYYKNG